MTAAIEARALTRRFGNFTAVDGIDLTVEEGELFGLLGPNGAGKTTLVRMLTALQAITSGEARVGGLDVTLHPDAVRQLLGVVPQALTSDLDLTAYENMDIYARFFGVDRPTRRTRIEHLLQTTGLWERRDDLVKTYSGGMRRRLEIARGLIHKPQVLFLDEPTIGLDPQSRRVIWELLRELRSGAALTISLTTHYLDEAEALCDRVAIVDKGKIVALGTPSALKAQVPGSDTLQVGVGGPVDEACLARLRALGKVHEATVGPEGLRLRVDGGAELLPRVLEVLSASGVRVVSASLVRVTLEEVFMHFTGRSIREEGPRRGGGGGPPRRFG